MNIDTWDLVFKTNYYTGETVETNLVYTPLTDGKIFCMNFDHTHPYQNEMVSRFLPQRPYYTEETVDYFFNRELEHIEVFKNFSWAPTYLEIDKSRRRIFFEWPGESFNTLVCGKQNLEKYCPSWENQLVQIVSDILNLGYYKLTIYPHCFFNTAGQMKVFDFYGCVLIKEPYLPVNKIRGIMGVASPERFEKAISGDLLNIKEMFLQALNGYSAWPTGRLKELALMVR